MPAIDSALSPIATCALRFGSMCQLVLMVGRAVTVTLPRRSALWSKVLPVRFCRLRPMSLLIRLPSALPTLPAWLAICPVTRTVPLSAVEMTSPSVLPTTDNGPRVSVQPIECLAIGGQRGGQIVNDDLLVADRFGVPWLAVGNGLAIREVARKPQPDS